MEPRPRDTRRGLSCNPSCRPRPDLCCARQVLHFVAGVLERRRRGRARRGSVLHGARAGPR
eukprot:8679127-Lingulodinium_polyedra.AAC.1